MTAATNTQSVDYLLIGGGLAAATAAAAIRARDPQRRVLIVTREPEYPYHRPPLSKEYLRGEIAADGVYGEGGVYVQPPAWYAQQRVEVVSGVEARALDPVARQVRLADGQAFHYGMLLLAMGGRARRLPVPGMDLPGVYVLRTLADASALRGQLQTPGKRVVAVGSGFIGLETAASALTKGAQVTIVDPLPRVWPQLMSPALSAYFQRQFERRGATLRHQRTVTEFLVGAYGQLAAVRIAPAQGDGPAEEVPCDLAIVGIGIQLNTELVASAGLEVDPHHGIVVNERLETRAAGVFAAGDVAAYLDPVAGHMHFEHWDNAIASGQVAGANMSGGDEPYRHVPYFFSDQFDYTINTLGYPSSEAEIVVRGDMATDTFTALYVQNGTLRAALMLNDDAHMDLLRDLIAASVPVRDLERLADPAVPLSTLAPDQR
jgi:3-phenylpropionate/trans-cinnamate dioxygenase ferredoxin reductase subunit